MSELPCKPEVDCGWVEWADGELADLEQQMDEIFAPFEPTNAPVQADFDDDVQEDLSSDGEVAVRNLDGNAQDFFFFGRHWLVLFYLLCSNQNF